MGVHNTEIGYSGQGLRINEPLAALRSRKECENKEGAQNRTQEQPEDGCRGGHSQPSRERDRGPGSACFGVLLRAKMRGREHSSITDTLAAAWRLKRGMRTAKLHIRTGRARSAEGGVRANRMLGTLLGREGEGREALGVSAGQQG